MQRALLACTFHALASASSLAGLSSWQAQYTPKPHPCTLAVGSRDACLTAGCTFLELEGENRCLPCEMDDIDWPCPSVGSVYAMKMVKTCTMACSHQKTVQKLSPCEDITGDITLQQCFGKGSSALTSCMWTQFLEGGALKAHCGPCAVEGVGKIPCVGGGMYGPTPGGTSIATMCFSQCENDCPQPMLPGCTGLNTPEPAAFPPTPQPAETLNLHFSKDAPNYVTVKVPPPYGLHEYEMAARAGAQTAMWGPDTLQPPTAPLSIYGPAPPEGPTIPPGMPVLYGPAPPGMIGAPPPGYGFGTAPPPNLVAMAKDAFVQTTGRKVLLRKPHA